jgi:hypothetical protein
MILKRKIMLADLDGIDADLLHAFTISKDRFGEMIVIKLKPGGAYVFFIEYPISCCICEQFDTCLPGSIKPNSCRLINVSDYQGYEMNDEVIQWCWQAI